MEKGHTYQEARLSNSVPRNYQNRKKSCILRTTETIKERDGMICVEMELKEQNQITTVWHGNSFKGKTKQ